MGSVAGVRDRAPRRAAPVRIEPKSPAAVEAMRRSGAVLAEALALLRSRCLPGVTTGELDALAREFIAARGGIPSFLGHPGPSPYPAAICTSINDEVVHGIPGGRLLAEGDIVSLDAGVILDGWHSDAAITLPVGRVAEPAARLIADAEAALAAAIEMARAGNRLGDIAAAVQRVARRGGYGVVREFTGHGIGRAMHEGFDVPNYPVPGAGSGPVLRPGTTFTIEPVFTLGSPEIAFREDGWTAVTVDGSPAAHVEHTVVVAPRGPATILTQLV